MGGRGCRAGRGWGSGSLMCGCVQRAACPRALPRCPAALPCPAAGSGRACRGPGGNGAGQRGALLPQPAARGVWAAAEAGVEAAEPRPPAAGAPPWLRLSCVNGSTGEAALAARPGLARPATATLVCSTGLPVCTQRSCMQPRRSWHLADVALPWHATRGPPPAPLFPLPPALQVITLMQTLVLGFVLAALFSDIPQTVAGMQDELGVRALWPGARLG